MDDCVGNDIDNSLVIKCSSLLVTLTPVMLTLVTLTPVSLMPVTRRSDVIGETPTYVYNELAQILYCFVAEYLVPYNVM